MLKTEEEAINNLINHELTGPGHFDEMIKEFNLSTIGVLEYKLDVEVFLLEAKEVVLIVAEVHWDELETCGIDIYWFPSFPFFEFLLAII